MRSAALSIIRRFAGTNLSYTDSQGLESSLLYYEAVDLNTVFPAGQLDFRAGNSLENMPGKRIMMRTGMQTPGIYAPGIHSLKGYGSPTLELPLREIQQP